MKLKVQTLKVNNSPFSNTISGQCAFMPSTLHSNLWLTETFIQLDFKSASLKRVDKNIQDRAAALAMELSRFG